MPRLVIALRAVLTAGALLGCGGALVGCGGTLQVAALVPVPPELPVRVFPELAIVHGTTPDDLDVADALARHLGASSAGTRVEHLDQDALDARRASFGRA
ncbi:MAG: hypothetical protein M3Y87_27910, partial [Myxococcota bacterium]|nr:hypothetical protein [Myxococcota bacterium]